MNIYFIFVIFVICVECERPPSLAQRFSAGFSISHPLTGVLGRGTIYMDYSKHSIKGRFQLI